MIAHGPGGQDQLPGDRLVHSALAHSTTRLRDDASMLYLRWNGPDPLL